THTHTHTNTHIQIHSVFVDIIKSDRYTNTTHTNTHSPSNTHTHTLSTYVHFNRPSSHHPLFSPPCRPPGVCVLCGCCPGNRAGNLVPAAPRSPGSVVSPHHDGDWKTTTEQNQALL